MQSLKLNSVRSNVIKNEILRHIPDNLFSVAYNLFLSDNKHISITKDHIGWKIIGELENDVSLYSPTAKFFNVHYSKFTDKFDRYFKIEQGETVLDVGACVGDTTIFMGLRSGVKGKVIAVEPNPQNCSCLRMNASNYIGNYEIHELAASNKKGEFTLYLHSTPTGHALLPDKSRKNSIIVKTDTIDNILQGRKIDFAKIDVQGSEIEVLEGADYLLKTTPKLMVETHYKYLDRKTYPKVIDILESYGYKVDFTFDNGVVYAQK